MPTRPRPPQPPRLPKHLHREAPAALEPGGEYLAAAWTGVPLARQEAARAVFEQVHWRQVVVAHSRLPQARFSDARLEAADLSGVMLERGRLRRVSLSACRLTGLNGLETTWEEALFEDDLCEGAVFAAASFKHTRFVRCRLTNALFEGADLTGVVFDQCDLTGVNLRGARLAGADLRGSMLNGVLVDARDLAGAIVDAAQAVQIAGLLGLRVHEVGEDVDADA